MKPAALTNGSLQKRKKRIRGCFYGKLRKILNLPSDQTNIR